jgi:hypothetical protein
MIYDMNQTNLMFDNEILESIFGLGGLLYENYYYYYYFGQSSQYEVICFLFSFVMLPQWQSSTKTLIFPHLDRLAKMIFSHNINIHVQYML